MSVLFSPVEIGPYTLAHRVVMAPLTRLRAGDDDIPNALMAEYYGQRATSGGLIITETTAMSPTGRGYVGAPGIYDDRQVAGWRSVTDAVYAKGGHIFLQVFHAGRQSHVDLQPDGGAPLAPSAIRADGYAVTKNGLAEFSAPRALQRSEISAIVDQFRLAAQRALAAGFDGVEIHGANGYLLDQFLQDGSNKRTDEYGGPIENRARLLLEVADAVISVMGAGRVGLRLAPSGTFGSMSDSDPAATFGYVAEQLSIRGIGYLHVIEPRMRGPEEVEVDRGAVDAAYLRPRFKGTLIAAGGFTGESAEAIVAAGVVDMVAFGRHFVANPDLVDRLRRKLPLNRYDRDTFYSGGERGYVDYPFYGEALMSA